MLEETVAGMMVVLEATLLLLLLVLLLLLRLRLLWSHSLLPSPLFW